MPPKKQSTSGIVRNKKVQTIKMVVMGAGGVGKSALVTSFVSGTFTKKCDPTIIESYRKIVDFGGNDYEIEVLDAAGTEQFTAIRDLYIKNGQVFFLVFSIISSSTFNQLTRVHAEIMKVKDVEKLPMFLVGNHKERDAEDRRQVSVEQAQGFAAKLGITYMETKWAENTTPLFMAGLEAFLFPEPDQIRRQFRLPSAKDYTEYKTLSLNKKAIIEIPSAFLLSSTFFKLEKLILSNNSIREFPNFDTMGLPNIISIDLSENELTKLPKLTKNTKLEKFICRKNQLDTANFDFFPPSIVEIDLSANQITTLHGKPSSIPALEALNVSDNKLNELPCELCTLTKLKLDASGNHHLKLPIQFSIPPKRITLDKTKFSDHLKFWDLYPGGTLKEGKLLLLGHGAAGKTSLLQILNQNQKMKGDLPDTMSTIGFDIVELVLSKAGDFKFLAHDFAGQIEYMTTHKFFLSTAESSVYFIVVDLSVEQSKIKENLQHWIGFFVENVLNKADSKDLNHFNLAFIGTKTDKIANFETHQPQIRQDTENAITSCFQDHNITPDKKYLEGRLFCISNEASNSEETKKSITAFLVAIAKRNIGVYVPGLFQWLSKRCFEPNLKDLTNETFLTGSKCAQMLTEKIQLDKTETLPFNPKDWLPHRGRMFSLLHDLGTVMYDQHHDVICLKPDIFSKLTSTFIGPPEHQQRLTGKQIDAILSKFEVFELIQQNEIFKNQNKEVYETILNFMESMRLCFKLKDQEIQHYGKEGNKVTVHPPSFPRGNTFWIMPLCGKPLIFSFSLAL